MSFEKMEIRGVSNHYGPRSTGGADGFLPSAGLTREMVLEAGGPTETNSVYLKKGWSVNLVAGITFKKASDGTAYSTAADDTAFTEDVIASVATGKKVVTVTQTMA